MPFCMKRRRRRMPTFNKHKNSISQSPLHHTLSTFATAVVRTTQALDKCLSPDGLQPAAPGIERHLRQAYDSLRGPGEDALSRTRFEEFIRDIQGETREPPWVFSTQDSFSFDRFCGTWWRHYSCAKKPIHLDDKDLEKPISNYFINSSHNTYIWDGNQLTGVAKARQYKKVLESGCRCVEIDVWNGSEKGENHEVQNQKSSKMKRRAHWSSASMKSWMKEACTATLCTSNAKGLKPKQSQQSFKASPPQRALPIANMTGRSETEIENLLATEPRVCHAYSTRAGDIHLHEPIPFREVCETIRDSAFSDENDLPIIISLEVHANGPQQEKMVEIMKEIWGDMLLDAYLAGCDPEKQQPTPGELRKKILIKAKTGSIEIPRKQSAWKRATRSILSKFAVNAAAIRSTTCAAIPPVSPSPDLEGTTVGSESSASGIHPYTVKALSVKKEAAHCQEKETSGKKIIVDSLKKLAIYTYSPGPFESFDYEDSKKPAHIFSFGEEKVKSLHKTHHKDLFRHNTKYLARTFPESLSSFLSSNPNYPTLFWRKGVQMVALNWQVWDTAMELNHAMFENERGWVLKPPGYRSGSSADCQASIAGKKRLELTITVLAGQNIPAMQEDPDEQLEEGTTRIFVSRADPDPLRPRVTCFLHVESAAERDPRKKVSKDETAKSTNVAQTEQPDWGSTGSRLHFTAEHVVEELSFVRLNVDHCGVGWAERTAQACIRLDRLQEGYRLIKLKTSDGFRSDGLLLVKIEKRLTDEARPVSRRVRTWNTCKKEVTKLACSK